MADKSGQSVFTPSGGMNQDDSIITPSADASGNFYIKPFLDTIFRIAHSFEIGSSPYVRNFMIPLAIPEKSDLDLRITTRANNGRYTASFDILLIDN